MAALRHALGLEVRQGGYTDTLIGSFLARASGHTVGAAATAGVQTAAGIVSRALMGATVDGSALGLVGPLMLAEVGWDLIRYGESVWLFRVDPRGRGALLRASATEPVVYGDQDPASWQYVLTLAGPANTQTVRATAESVVHIRWNTDPLQPWRGRAPLAVASATGALMANLEESLGYEASVAVARFLAVPQGTSPKIADGFRAMVNQPDRKRVIFPETTASGWGGGKAAAPTRDWRAERVGPDPTEGEVMLYGLVMQACCTASGVPAALAPGANAAGPAAREAQRQLLTGTIQPLGALIGAELSRVLEVPVMLHHDRLAASDIAGRARALKALTEAAIPLDEAKRLAGWEVAS